MHYTLRVVPIMAAMLATAPLGAQNTPPVRNQGRGAQTPPPATTPQTPGQFNVDFQDQPIRVVLSALAEAGKINITFSNLPNKAVSLRMQQPLTTRDQFVGAIKGIAEDNGLVVNDNGSLIRVYGLIVPVPKTQQQLRDSITNAQAVIIAQLNVQSLHTYQLKHSSAATIVPVLTALFQAQGGGRGGTGNVNLGGGAANQTGRGAQPAAGRGGNAGGAAGRTGGRGGGDEADYEVFDPNTGASMLVSGGTRPDTVWALNAQGTPVVDRVRVVSTDAGTFQIGAPQQGVAQQNPLAALGALFGAPQGGGNQIQAPRIGADAASNQLIIMANDSDWVKIQSILQTIDLRPLQVLIEVTIAEVTHNNDLTYGNAGRLAHKSGDVADTLTGGSGATSARDLVLRLVGHSGAIDYNVALNALQTRGDVRVLSMPVILAQNNVQAILNVGQTIPIISSSTTATTGGVPATTNQYVLQPVATTLTIIPTINVDGYVNMAVSQTDNNGVLDPVSGQFLINNREATTQVFLRDGQTTVLGGLAGKSVNKATSGIPILSSIPFIGPLLFGGRIESTETTELFLFLTPHIIDSDSSLDAMKDAAQRNSDLLKDLPIGKRFLTPPDSAAAGTTTSTGGATTNGGRGGGGGNLKKDRSLR